MSEELEIFSLDEYFTIKHAAMYLGVSPSTLRNWDRSGKLASHRNPMNGYRLYKKADLKVLLQRIQSGKTKQE